MKTVSATYYRLIALWVLCEAMLGGIIHAAKIPVSGLIVGSCAVTCICLIAFYVPSKGAIIKATVIVAIFKMMLSPQSPPLAYFAVFFQGFIGEILFWNRNFYRVSCLLLGLIALLESGLQRIIVLTIVYGNNFWKAINNFINELTGQKVFTNYSLVIGIIYVALHIVTGLLIGWWGGIIPGKAKKWSNQYGKTEDVQNGLKEFSVKAKRKRWIKKGVLVIWVCLVLVYCQSYFNLGKPILPSSLPLQIFIRSAMVIIAWYLVVGPIISFLIKRWLQKKQLRSKEEIQQVVLLLPGFRELIRQSWETSAGRKGLKRIILFSKIVFAGVLYDEE